MAIHGRKRVRVTTQTLDEVISLYNRGTPFNSLHRPSRITDRLELVNVNRLKQLYYDTRSPRVFERLITLQRVQELTDILEFLRSSKLRSDRVSYQSITSNSKYSELSLRLKNDRLVDMFVCSDPIMILRSGLIYNYTYPLVHLPQELPDNVMVELFNDDKLNCSPDNMKIIIDKLNELNASIPLVIVVLDVFGWRQARRFIELLNDDDMAILNECIQLLNLSKIPSLIECGRVGLRITYSSVLDRILCPGYGGVIEEVMNRLSPPFEIFLYIYLLITLDDTPNFNYHLLSNLKPKFNKYEVKSALNEILKVKSYVELFKLVKTHNKLEEELLLKCYKQLSDNSQFSTKIRQLIKLNDNEVDVAIQVHKEIVEIHRAIAEVIM
jgi:hypothetical protein